MYLGEVMKVEDGSPWVTSREYGAVNVRQRDPRKITWAARFQGTEDVAVGRHMVSKHLDELHIHANVKPSNMAFEPLLRQVKVLSVAEWDDAGEIFKKIPKKQRGRKINGRLMKKWILDQLHLNPRLYMDQDDSEAELEEEEEEEELKEEGEEEEVEEEEQESS